MIRRFCNLRYFKFLSESIHTIDAGLTTVWAKMNENKKSSKIKQPANFSADFKKIVRYANDSDVFLLNYTEAKKVEIFLLFRKYI